MLDSVRAQREGTKQLRFGYDVCGLAAGSPISGQVLVRRLQNRVQRMVRGSVEPVPLNWLETARSPRMRRTRIVDISTLPPGRYSLDMSITDARNRKEDRRREFDILEKRP